ncbi:MAG: tetratricopeptide repeat protein [Bacteroidetes bacterium]|nr:tetratricopeptide repeat protein [Bacteroidota bacterium]
MKNKKIYFLILFSFLNINCKVPEMISEPAKFYFGNFTTYFNIYYNANKFYEEGKKEIVKKENDELKNNLQNQIFELPVLKEIPQASNQKLMDAIAKSSKILSLHANSNVADDAVLLIGKCYYLMNDYLKAEKKFHELLQNSKETEIIEEAKLFLVKTYRKQKLFDKEDVYLSELIKSENSEIKSLALFEVGYKYQQQNKNKLALENYTNVLSSIDDTQLLPYLYYSLSDLSLKENKKKLAIEYLEKLEDLDDPLYKFLSKFEITKLSDKAEKINNLKALLTDPINKNYFGQIEYEVALNYYNDKNYDEAVNYFQKIDTLYRNSEVSALSNFKQAEYYELNKINYSKALTKYKLAIDGKLPTELKINASERYKSLEIYSSTKKESERLQNLIFTTDTLLISANKDSVKTHLLNEKDSLSKLIMLQNYELATFFYLNKNNPDSAISYLKRIIDNETKSDFIVNAIYLYSEIKKQNEKLRDSLYNILLSVYPNSIYSAKIKQIKNIVTEKSISKIEEAENYFQNKNYKKASELYFAIMNNSEFPKEKEKAILALGFIYENYLNKPDSAKYFYNKYVKAFPESIQTGKLKLKIKDPEIVKSDSLK